METIPNAREEIWRRSTAWQKPLGFFFLMLYLLLDISVLLLVFPIYFIFNFSIFLENVIALHSTDNLSLHPPISM